MDSATLFMILFVLILVTLGIMNFIDFPEDKTGDGHPFFGTLYIVGAFILIVYNFKRK